MKRYLLLSFVVITIMASCQPSQDSINANQDRPYDPWISRSVLDEQARMITLALHDDLWVAYSTQNCSLYKIWKGYVNFEGAVYNTAHGPQPVSVGDAFIVNVFDKPWRITQGKSEISTQAQYAGHRIRDGHAELMYDLYAKNIGPIRVYEMVEFTVNDAGQMGLSRTYTTENVPDGYGVMFLMNINSIVSQRDIITDGELTVYEEEEKMFGNRELIEMEGHLELKPNSTTQLSIYFIDKPTIKNKYQTEAGKTADLPLGFRLISRSDCKTCHNTNVQTIGPSYTAIAEKYPTSEKSVDMLVDKVIAGGAGIWGFQVMSPHPDVSKTDAQAMVRWILDLDDDDAGESAEGEQTVGEALKPADVDGNSLLPGALTEIYEFDKHLREIPKKPVQDPKMAGTMVEFANLHNTDFKDLSGDFALYASGYLRIEIEGTYIFRLWSDDGTKFWLNDELFIDHDGPHGTSSKETIVVLEKGYYPFRLEYYQGGGDKFLSLNCLLPNTSEFITIPPEMYYHNADRMIELSGKSLPMSVNNRFPGDQFSLTDVHPSYDLSMARPDDFLPKVGGMDFLDNGKLVISTWDATGSVYLLSNLEAEDPNDIVVKKIADGFAEPLGLKVVDNEIYILQKQELTKLVDLDGDEISDEYQTISNDWKTSANFHEFSFGLVYQDGYFYANLATAIVPGGASVNPQIEDRGKVMKINAATGAVEFIAHGLRTPNGIGIGVDDEIFVSDNQGDWLPASKIMHVKPGVWFGSRSVDFEGTEDLKPLLPVVWLPQDEIGNSPSTPMLIKDGPYAGQMMHGEVTHGGLKRVFVEKVNGDYQGVVFRFIQGLEAGINRMAYGPDGSLYVGGIGNPGNWAQTGKLWYGLQRLKYNDEPTFEMLAIRAKTNGVEIEFTEPLKEGDGWNFSDYDIKQWSYVPTIDYGGPKIDEEKLRIRSVNISEDRKKVFLELSGMKKDRVVYIHLLKHFVSAAGRQLWSTEGWYTMNSIPENANGLKRQQPITYFGNTLTGEEKEAGWKLLFDGVSMSEWKRFKDPDIGKSWIVEDHTITLDAKQNAEGQWHVEDRGDLITVEEYENYELNLEWKISNCGNSGIMFNVVESDDYGNTWETGPEMQILDNTCHPDSRFPTHRAGDLYDMIECSYVTVKPAGEWNSVRLIKNGGKMEHWLNGVKVVEYEMYTPAWDEMIANSKFKDMPGFGRATKGHIALQDHGDARVAFRNIKILEL